MTYREWTIGIWRVGQWTIGVLWDYVTLESIRIHGPIRRMLDQ